MATNTAEVDALFAKLAAEDAAALAAEPAPTPEEVEREAEFLRGWSKGKPISHEMATFHRCGRWMTKLSPKMVDALLAGGYVVGTTRRFTVAK